MSTPDQGFPSPEATEAPRTSKLAIVALILALVPICLNYVGFVLGIVAAVQISKNKATQKGMGLAIAAIVIGAIWIPISMMAAIAIPNFMRFQARAKQSEAKSNLSMIYVAETAWQAEAGGFSDDFEKIGFFPEPNNRYTYYLGASTAPATHHESEVAPLPADLQTGVSPEGFLAAAVANLDGDATLDVWIIDQDRNLQNLVDDVHE
ncbi:MAG: hypothetical protein P1V51_25175 [Deltaproteobacteria bacterium]|nr:hypothetical protein [Deltaproteobacteria bacterium]